MRAPNKISASHVRLFLAVCLCLFLFIATTTTPNEGNGCSEHDHGDLMILNISPYEIHGIISGLGLRDFRVEINPTWSKTYKLKTGGYRYLLYQIDEDNEKMRIRVGMFTIFPQQKTELTYK